MTRAIRDFVFVCMFFTILAGLRLVGVKPEDLIGD